MIHQALTQLPTEFGTFTVHVYRNNQNEEVTAICAGEVQGQTELPVRVHSACFTAEALGSLKCDCKLQLEYAMEYISKHGGIVIYLPQEGRGIGLSNKIRAYALQERGHDTIEANRLLGLPIDGRSYEDARDILNHLGVASIQLLTNNPEKLTGLRKLGINVTGRLPVICEANAHSASYLDTKQKHMGHMLAEESPSQQGGSCVVQLREPRSQTRPFIHVNLAITGQAQTAACNGDQISISCDQDWQRVHQLREKYCAVAVGAKTWISDKPRLTARQDILGRKATKQPARVIFAGKHDCRIHAEEDLRRTFLVGQPKTAFSIEHTVISSADHNLAFPLARLREQGVQSMLVEGGLKLICSFIEQDMVDLLTVYAATDCVQTAINSVVTAMPALSQSQIEAEAYGQGVLLSLTMRSENGQIMPSREVLL